MQTFRNIEGTKYILAKNNGWVLVSKTGSLFNISVGYSALNNFGHQWVNCSIKEFTEFIDQPISMIVGLMEPPKQYKGLASLLPDSVKMPN